MTSIIVTEPAKRLYRSRADRKLGGVLGGLAEYFGLDPTWLRLGFAVLVIFTGLFPFALVYAVACFIIPEAPDGPGGSSGGDSGTVQ